MDAHLDYSPEYVIIPESGTYGIQNVADSDYYTNSIIVSEPDREYPFSFKDMDVYMINGDVLLTYNDIKIVFNKDDSVDIPGGTAEMAVLFGEEGYDIVLDGKLKSFGTYDTVSYLLKDNELRRIG